MESRTLSLHLELQEGKKIPKTPSLGVLKHLKTDLFLYNFKTLENLVGTDKILVWGAFGVAGCCHHGMVGAADPPGIQQSPGMGDAGKAAAQVVRRHLGMMGCPFWVPSWVPAELGASQPLGSSGWKGERGWRAPGEGRRGVWSKLREIAFLLSAAAGRAAERKSVFC